ncbi:MAG: short-chain dehydrogenase [candidate division KSB1 bacterium]|nr:short-chain dehydrogenase [candidate division KSB1 bacterium]MDZ7275241.1 short-chain dehydrogenase [candidate division KSB1 bacterium]MDZ7287409.1 short-chain dehydrogenase [candidate division KSB1 bacterium]MDZ7299523.1 short-chain dehydrogenase [candidate division KSB1 bacterium]MDZ7305432.1 short-chain dehydrogenase [candidate division KSB1 bacterium]
MEIQNKTVLVLGGWGLVGMAVCRQALSEHPKELIVASLTEAEARDAVLQLREEYAGPCRITPAWGNIFVRDTLQGKSRQEILQDETLRAMLIEDVLDELNEAILQHSLLFQIIQQYRPNLIVDCVNSATAVAYQDVFASYYRIRGHLAQVKQQQASPAALVAEVEKLLCTLYVPQLIRHVQILYEAMRRARTEVYVKVGTSGTGGMGLNIPYTHSEEKPSRVLLSKSSIAGAHTMLLFLMARTPDAPITKEIKPTAAIAWKRIAYGPVLRQGRPIPLYDCPPQAAVTLDDKLVLQDGAAGSAPWQALDGEVLQSVFVDTGENGIFSLGEFTAISDSGQMELVTPEEIARNILYEVKGGNTGHDIINALDNSVMGPTYRAGVMRAAVLQQMKELAAAHKVDSVAFELLGPPRLSKLLFEAHLLKLVFRTMAAVRAQQPEEMAARLEAELLRNARLRAEIISIGIPILLSDGRRLLRGPEIKIPPFRGSNVLALTPDHLEQWAHDGWVDLRAANMRLWQSRMEKIEEEIRAIPERDTSSRYMRNRRYWQEEDGIDIGKLVGWIFSTEEKGARMKE